MYRIVILIVFWLGLTGTSIAHSLVVQEIDSITRQSVPGEHPDQLPHSRVTQGSRDIAAAWLAGPTDRYAHGVLGDALEASRLVLRLRHGDTLTFELPLTRVFEDLQPRLEDLDGDKKDEILLVESDVDLGASLAVYGITGGQITLRAQTPFLGQPNRWLNPVGSGDFDGDGHLDVATVITPHIGGILRLYRFSEPSLIQYAELKGVSTHQIGSTELGLGQVVTLQNGTDGLLLPDQSRRTLMLLRWSSGAMHELARVSLPSPVNSSLVPVPVNRWQFSTEDGRYLELRLD